MRITKKKSKKKQLLIGTISLIVLFIFTFYKVNQEQQTASKLRKISSKVVDESKKKINNLEEKNNSTKKGHSNSAPKSAGNDNEDNHLRWTDTPVKEAIGYPDVNRPSVEDIKNAPNEINRQSYLGSVEIEELGLYTNVFKYLDEETNSVSLLQGAMEGLKKQTLGKGNYVLLGHNLGYSNVLFSDLPKVEKGMRVIVSDKKTTKSFKVTDIKTVRETDTSVYNLSKDPKLTLITCDKATATKNRVIVTAALDE